jgi:hypothetical protein
MLRSMSMRGVGDAKLIVTVELAEGCVHSLRLIEAGFLSSALWAMTVECKAGGC